MAQRGIGAMTKEERAKVAASVPTVFAWDAKGLSRAGRVIAFLESLPITQGKLAGTLLKLRPWQIEWLEAVYATDDDGHRFVRTALMSIGRKNGKTALCAGLSLCHLLGPESEARGEVYCAANDRNQAGKLFDEVAAIIKETPHMRYRTNITVFKKRIEVIEGQGAGSILAALAADARTVHGLSPSFTVVDELGQAKSAALYEALDTAQGARDEPLLCCISTQAADDNAPLSHLVDYGEQVNAGEIEDASFVSRLYAAPADCNLLDETAWLAANPALGDFRSLSDVRRQAEQAVRIPAKEHAFRNLILNQRVSAHVRFLSASEWDGNNATPLSLVGRKCFGGLDLSASRDLTAFVLVFPNDDGSYDVLPQFFMPEDNLRERSEEDRVPYDVWVKQGHITAIAGPVIDPSFVAEAMAEANAIYDLQTVAYDRWRIELLRKELSAIGADLPLEPHGQGFKDMAPAVDLVERLVVERKLRHGGNPVLRMCAANAVVTTDPAGNRKLDKAKANGRIDGLVALAMGLRVADLGLNKWEPEIVMVR